MKITFGLDNGRWIPWMGPAVALFITALCALAVVELRRNFVFPFVELEVRETAEEFNAMTSYYYSQRGMGIQDLTREVRRVMRHDNTAPMLTRRPYISFEDSSVPGVCSEYAKVASSFFSGERYISRVVWLSTHTVMEIWEPYYHKWVLIDTSGNQIWYNSDRIPMSVTELIHGWEEAEPRPIIPADEIAANPHLADGLNFGPEGIKHYRDTEVCVVIDNEYLFRFHHRTRDPYQLALAFLGLEPVATGFQYIPDDGLPRAGSVLIPLRLIVAALLLTWSIAVVWFFVWRVKRPKARMATGNEVSPD